MDDYRHALRQLALAVVVATGLVPTAAPADVDLDDYRRFLAANTGRTATDMQVEYGLDVFASHAGIDLSAASYADSVTEHFGLTAYEQSLLERHGFVVTERIHPSSFGHGFLEVYNADLPVFISTDAVLHALHMSYDAILRDLEGQLLLPLLRRGLAAMHAALPAMVEQYATQPAMAPMLGDVDLYLTVARRLAGPSADEAPAAPVLADTDEALGDLLTAISNGALESVTLFGAPRQVDFSQFKPRGHYTQDYHLLQYFRAMMWLGRIELYIDSPPGGVPMASIEALIRQTIDAVLLDEIAARSGADADLAQIDRLLTAFVGESDNLTSAELRAVRAEMDLEEPADLLDEDVAARFRTGAAERASQRILSQVLFRNPLAAEELAGAPAFLLLGQRFIIDSYIFANVVYDKILHDGHAVFRGLPSSLDALFALGNNTAIQLLDEELARYHYAPNLAALRHLVDAQSPDFWEQSLYNGWLQAIRTLNPPSERSGLPPFMRTQAWWLQKMNTQLAAWAQLRHDNLLYAKQSYTAGVVCCFPATYVEPVPAFYDAVGRFAEHARQILGGEASAGTVGGRAPIQRRIARYFEGMAQIADTLGTVARKELSATPFTEAENLFLQTVVYEEAICGVTFGGWYTRLYYNGESDMAKEDMVIADVHTQPTDEAGATVGKVLHVGTGPLDLAVIVAQVPGRGSFAFAGPVLSFYEHVTVGFERLTDEEWQSTVREATPAFRPDLVNLYLAGSQGTRRGDPRLLPTAVHSTAAAPIDSFSAALETSSHPNPFNAHTLIRFRVSSTLAGQHARLTIYNAAGQAVRTLLDEPLPAGAYTARWDATDELGADAASGTYLYQLAVGEVQRNGRMTLLR